MPHPGSSPARAPGGSTACLFLAWWVLLAAAAPALAAAPPAPPPPLGLSHHFLHWDELHPLAPAWVRVNLHWGYFQPTSEPDTARWSWQNDETVQLDSLLAGSYRALAVVRTGSVWANRGTGSLPYEGFSSPPLDLAAAWDPATGYSPSYHRFIHALVRHYNGDGTRRIPILVVENEANSGTWWRGLEEGDSPAEVADQYLRLLATAYHAAREADPGIRVADSGLASLAWGASLVKEMLDRGAPAESTLAFANGYFARNFGDPSGFPYRWESLEALREDFEVTWAGLISETQERVGAILAGLKPSDRFGSGEANVDLLNLHFYENHWMLAPVLDWVRAELGGRLPPLLSSEIGMNSGATAPGDWAAHYAAYGDFDAEGDFDDTEGPAHELIAKTVAALGAGVAPACWFILDGTGNRAVSDKLELVLFADDPAAGYPVLRHRPAYYAYGFLARQLSRGGGHVAPPARDTCLAPSVYRYVFDDAASGAPDLEVLWWDDGSWRPFGLAARGGATIEIPPPEGATGARLYGDYLYPDLFEARALASGAPLTLAVTEHPVALVWEGAAGAPAGAPGPSCGQVTGEAPPHAPRDYGWQGLRVVPNPVAEAAAVLLHLPGRARVRLAAYDVEGRERASLLDADLSPGWHRVAWDARDAHGRRLPPGVYFVEARMEGDLPHLGPAGSVGGGRAKVLIVR